jgi:hypothetical protein
VNIALDDREWAGFEKFCQIFRSIASGFGHRERGTASLEKREQCSRAGVLAAMAETAKQFPIVKGAAR